MWAGCDHGCLSARGAELNLRDRVLSEVEKSNFIALPGRGGYSRLLPSKTKCPLRRHQDPAPAPRLHCGFLAAPPVSLHPLPSLISSRWNLPFGTQGRSWRLKGRAPRAQEPLQGPAQFQLWTLLDHLGEWVIGSLNNVLIQAAHPGTTLWGAFHHPTPPRCWKSFVSLRCHSDHGRHGGDGRLLLDYGASFLD